MSNQPMWRDQVDPDSLDRLVDGEMTIDETRRLVEQLEENPEGWRQCALTFLEAQALSQELASDANRPSDSKMPDTAREKRAQTDSLKREVGRPNRGAAWQRSMLVAASILVAFSIGLYARTVLFSGSSDVDSSASNDGASAPSAAGIGDNGATTLVGGPQDSSGRVQFVYEGNELDSPPREIEVPVYDKTAMPIPYRGGLTDETRRWLQDSGIRVRTRRQLINVTANNGENVVVPIETYEFVPSSDRYQ